MIADIRNEFIALDTNEYLFALRGDSRFPACARLLYEHVHDLRIHVPLQVLKEVHKRLRQADVRLVLDALEVAKECRFDYAPGKATRVVHWEHQGAKKGDAVIIVQLEAAEVLFLISENRHFLGEVRGLPFEVLSSAEAIARLGVD